MTRKHYVKIAKIIKDNTLTIEDVMRDTQPILNKDSFVNILCDMLYKDNNLFDRQRFIDACND